MNELSIRSDNLPQNIQDLSKFVLVGREKLISVKAEIRAINKLEFAQEVRNQKREEARMLSEALLDAEVRLGELFREIPKTPGKRTDIEPTLPREERLTEKPKHQVITDLGFSRQQAEKMETLSENKDLVEVVKQEAVENDDLPTRSRVLDLATQRKKREPEADLNRKEYSEYLNKCEAVGKKIDKAIKGMMLLDVDADNLRMWDELNDDIRDVYLEELTEIQAKVTTMLTFIKRRK